MNLYDLRKVEDVDKNNHDVALYVNRLFDDTKNKYLKIQRDWYVNERFVRGDHWVVFNKTLNKVQNIPLSGGEIRRTVNKIRSQVRGVKNFIKRSQPRWQVQPDDGSDEAHEIALKKNKILQNIYRNLKFTMILTDTIVSGLKYSVGFIEGGVVNENGKNVIKFWHDDTFDIYIDPTATNLQDARYIFKAFKKPIVTVKNNSSYKIKGKIVSDSGVSSSYKDLLNREKYGHSETKSEDMETVLVKELWIKYNGKLKLFTVVNNQLVRVSDPKYRRYPFFNYSPEREPSSIYGDAWIKDLISLNKSLDKSTSQIESYVQRMLGGKFMIKQGVEVSSITDKGAEKIYYKGTTPPTQLNLQPLPVAPFNHASNLERWIEEFGGAREASLGRAPASIQSGKALEALQSADAGTVAEPIENLEIMLSDIGEFILELIEDYTIASEKIVEEGKEIKYIGAGAGTELPESVIKIKSGKVKVVIVPEIAYSEEAKFDRLIRLAEAKLIDPETILDKLAFSNISDIMERVNKLREEKFKEEMVKQKESHRSDGNAPDDSATLADQENMQMAAGQDVPNTPKALWIPEHTQLHLSFIQENQDAYNNNKDLFDAHILAEEQYNQ